MIKKYIIKTCHKVLVNLPLFSPKRLAHSSDVCNLTFSPSVRIESKEAKNEQTPWREY